MQSKRLSADERDCFPSPKKVLTASYEKLVRLVDIQAKCVLALQILGSEIFVDVTADKTAGKRDSLTILSECILVISGTESRTDAMKLIAKEHAQYLIDSFRQKSESDAYFLIGRITAYLESIPAVSREIFHMDAFFEKLTGCDTASSSSSSSTSSRAAI